MLAKLDYAYESLEPHIDTLTMKVHHTKHHQAYIDNFNKALENHPELHAKNIEEILINLSSMPEDVKKAIQNHGGGHYGHLLFWLTLTPNGQEKPFGPLGEAIIKTFGSFDAFKEKFNKTAQTVFGSGWAWLCLDQQNNLIIMPTSNQDSPLSQGYKPLFCIDVWEHAYYLKYQNRRMEFVAAWWHILNWEKIEDNYQRALKS